MTSPGRQLSHEPQDAISVDGDSAGDQSVVAHDETGPSRQYKGQGPSRNVPEDDERESERDPWAARHKKRRLKGPSARKFLRELLALVAADTNGGLSTPSILALLRRNGLLPEDVEMYDVTESDRGFPDVIGDGQVSSDVGDGTQGSESELELNSHPEDEEQKVSGTGRIEEILTTVRGCHTSRTFPLS